MVGCTVLVQSRAARMRDWRVQEPEYVPPSNSCTTRLTSSLLAVDWIPLSSGSVRPTQGRTLGICQINGGSQSFNTVNQLRLLGRWMRMFTVSTSVLWSRDRI